MEEDFARILDIKSSNELNFENVLIDDAQEIEQSITGNIKKKKISSLKKKILATRHSNDDKTTKIPNNLPHSFRVYKARSKPSIKRYYRRKHDTRKTENVVTLTQFLTSGKKTDKPVLPEQASGGATHNKSALKNLLQNPNVEDHKQQTSKSSKRIHDKIDDSIRETNAINLASRTNKKPEDLDLKVDKLCRDLTEHLRVFYLNMASLTPLNTVYNNEQYHSSVIFDSSQELIKGIVFATKKRTFVDNFCTDYIGYFLKNPQLKFPPDPPNMTPQKSIQEEFVNLKTLNNAFLHESVAIHSLNHKMKNNVPAEIPTLKLSPNLISMLSIIDNFYEQNRLPKYCDHYIDLEIENLSTKLLQTLSNFYAKKLFECLQAQKSPNIVKKRLIFGIKDIKKALYLCKLEAIILATDIEDVPGPGGLNELINELIQISRHFSVPTIFSCSKKTMYKYVIDVKYVVRVYPQLLLAQQNQLKSQTTSSQDINTTETKVNDLTGLASFQKKFYRQFRKINVSAIGILNYEGADRYYKQLIQLVSTRKENLWKDIMLKFESLQNVDNNES